ncbi:MAG: hypothetical protein R2762_28855 [Bryobacteraceae bacterium]
MVAPFHRQMPPEPGRKPVPFGPESRTRPLFEAAILFAGGLFQALLDLRRRERLDRPQCFGAPRAGRRIGQRQHPRRAIGSLGREEKKQDVVAAHSRCAPHAALRASSS